MHHFEQRLVFRAARPKPQRLVETSASRRLSIWSFYSASRHENLASGRFIQHLAVLFSISTRESGISLFYSASGRFIQHLDKRIWHLAVLFSISLSKKNLASGRFIQHLDFSSSQIIFSISFIFRVWIWRNIQHLVSRSLGPIPRPGSVGNKQCGN